jgi:Flp pilus assembly protein TadD
MTLRLTITRTLWMVSRRPERVRLVVLGAVISAMAVISVGCAITPRQAAPAGAAAAPAGSEDANSSPGDQAGVSNLKTDFHEKPTDRQRFQVHIDFGRVFEAQGNLDGAVLEYQDALTVVENKRHGPFRPSDEALAHRRMGGALDRLGRFAQAEMHYKKALKLSSKDPKIWNDAGYSYYLQGRWAEAEQTLKTAAKLAPDDERIRVNLGLALAAAGKTSEALPLLSKTGGDAVGHANLGYLLAATGQLDLARLHYEQAKALRPDLELPPRALARIDRQEGKLQPPGAAPTIMAKSVRSTARPIDSRVTQTSTARAKIPPPLPSRILPESRAASLVDRVGSPMPSNAPDLVPLPPAPPL